MTYEYNHKVDKLSVFLHLKLFFPGPSLEQNLRTLSVYIYTAAPRSDGQKMKTKTLEWWGRSSEDILVCCGWLTKMSLDDTVLVPYLSWLERWS